MFSPDPAKAQEPVYLNPGQSFVLHLRPFTPPAGRTTDNTIRRTVSGASELRYCTDGQKVKVASNYDPYAGPPAKYFQAMEGEYALGPKVEAISFTAQPNDRAVIFLEIR